LQIAKKDFGLLYLTGKHVPDNIAVVFDGQQTTALVIALEIPRLRNVSKIDKFVGWDSMTLSIQSLKVIDFDILEQFLRSLE
jgi:hypothetical protein